MSKTCAGALAPKKLETAVKNIKESEDRSRNLIVHGLVEVDSEDLKSKVADVITSLKLEEKPLFSIPCRVGIPNAKKARPVKISLISSSMVTDILKKSHLLRLTEEFTNVYLSPDRTREERTARRELVTLLMN